MRFVVCYDIVCDRRRARVFKKMKAFLPRVQKSVFEGELADDCLLRLREMIVAEIDQTEDTVRIYQLCGRCVPAIDLFGTGVYIQQDDDDEIV